MTAQNSLLSIPAKDYHTAPGVSASMLDQIRKSPAHMKAYVDGELREESDALSLGTLIHRVVLEPDTLAGAFHAKPEGMSFATKDGKQWRDEHGDRPIISAADAVTVNRVRDAVWKHPATKSLLSGGFAEQSLFVEDDLGTVRKSRFDYISTSGNFIPDLKTTRDASLEEFEKSIAKYHYHDRAAYYLDNAELAGLKKDTFIFICAETAPPYNVAVYQLSDYVLEAGRIFYRRNLQVYRNCLESGKWPGYGDAIQEIGLPAWQMRQLEEII